MRKQRSNETQERKFSLTELTERAGVPDPVKFNDVVLDSANTFKKILEKGQKLASVFAGTCHSKTSFTCFKGNNTLSFTCLHGHKFNLSEDLLSSLDLQAIENEFKLAQKDLKSFSASKKDKSCPLPLKSMTYMEERWCQRCCEVYNQAIQSTQSSQFHVLGGLYSCSLTLCCKKNKHIHSLSHSKLKALHLPCEHCKKNERQQERLVIKA